ncbi:hypothetical protein Taro_002777 [Colocasia esculenta]|uniref:Uncharacterized protein n=1 Tax=Colocasia esculenta TaxID=4460 RepID=A0A843TK54_COLES|nr:hypothetical protein [Colocasia esculenta]
MKTGFTVSTQSQAVSTLDPVSRRPICWTGTMCRHSQPSFQEEGHGNQGESLERRLLF